MGVYDFKILLHTQHGPGYLQVLARGRPLSALGHRAAAMRCVGIQLAWFTHRTVTRTHAKQSSGNVEQGGRSLPSEAE